MTNLVPEKDLSRAVLAQVAFRSLLLEASWNNRGQQNLGLAAAVDPALKILYRPGAELTEARKRALEFFNTNPIVSGLAIGVLLKLEREVAAGRRPPAYRQRVAASLNSSLAYLGDDLFWNSWLPFCSLVTVWTALSFNFPWTPLLLPVLFCLPALPLRFFGLFLAYRRGEGITDLIHRLRLQRVSQALKRAVAVLVGVSTVILVAARTDYSAGFSLSGLWLTMALVVVCVIFMRRLALKTNVLNYWYPFFLVTAAGLVLMALDGFGG